MASAADVREVDAIRTRRPMFGRRNAARSSVVDLLGAQDWSIHETEDDGSEGLDLRLAERAIDGRDGSCVRNDGSEIGIGESAELLRRHHDERVVRAIDAVDDRAHPIRLRIATDHAAIAAGEVGGDQTHHRVVAEELATKIFAVTLGAAADRSREVFAAREGLRVIDDPSDVDGAVVDARTAPLEAQSAPNRREDDGDDDERAEARDDPDITRVAPRRFDRGHARSVFVVHALEATEAGVVVLSPDPGMGRRDGVAMVSGMNLTAPASRSSTNLSPDDARMIHAIYTFWFGAPAHDPDTLVAKFRRWYQGGAEIDRAIQAQFGDVVARMLAGQLTSWRTTPRGRLVTLVVLDQFTRNLYRETPQAYAGDDAALALAREMLASSDFGSFSLEERLFVTMPLVHTEDADVIGEAALVAKAMAEEAPPALRGPWMIGFERVCHYRSVVARFGRFPHRNAILGRASTAEELAFLEEEARRAPPLANADAITKSAADAS